MKRQFRVIFFIASVCYIVVGLLLFKNLEKQEMRSMQRLPDILENSYFLLAAFLYKGQDILDLIRNRLKVRINWVLLGVSAFVFVFLNILSYLAYYTDTSRYDFLLHNDIPMLFIVSPLLFIVLSGIAMVDAFQFKEPPNT